MSSTSVPFRSGKCHPSTPPPCGCIIRTRVDAFPSREAALVEREAHQVAPVLVELRVLAVRLAVDDPVLGPVDARPRRALLGAELHGRRDRRHLDAVHLVLAMPASPVSRSISGVRADWLPKCSTSVTRYFASKLGARVVVEVERVAGAQEERRPAPGEDLLAREHLLGAELGEALARVGREEARAVDADLAEPDAETGAVPETSSAGLVWS